MMVANRQCINNNIIEELHLQQEQEAQERVQKLEHRRAHITEYSDYQEILSKIDEITCSIDSIAFYLNTSPEAKTNDVKNGLDIIQQKIIDILHS